MLGPNLDIQLTAQRLSSTIESACTLHGTLHALYCCIVLYEILHVLNSDSQLLAALA